MGGDPRIYGEEDGDGDGDEEGEAMTDDEDSERVTHNLQERGAASFDANQL